MRKMTQAQRYRQEAIGMLSELYLPASRDYEFPPDVSREEIAGNIAKLAQLGRTERWRAAIRRWAAMVRANDGNLRHAFLQGMIYAGHACD